MGDARAIEADVEANGARGPHERSASDRARDPGAPRVLVVAPLYHTDRGGLGRQAVLLTERLAALGARPLVATRRMLGLPARAWSPAVELRPLRAGRPRVHNYEQASVRNLLTALRFSAGLVGLMVWRRRDYDLVHVHGASLPLLVAIPWAKALHKPVVGKVAALHQGVEAGDLRAHWGPLGQLLAWLAARADAYVATTREIAAALEAEGVPRERIVRLPNFIDPARFRPPSAAERLAARRELGLEERTVVLHSGRLTTRKACEVLLRAFAQATGGTAAAAPTSRDAAALEPPPAGDRPAPRPLLLFLGDGPRRPELEREAARLGLGDRVRFEGFREDVERYLAAADVLALASRVEGLPNALLEGMAAGLPVVATRLGGSLEVVQDGRTGLLVPTDDVDALAQALARLIGDPAERDALGAAGARRAAQTFALEALAPCYLELYRRLAAGEPPRGASLFEE